MSTKLLVAGIGLTFLALSSESTLKQPAVAAKSEAAADPEDAAFGSRHTSGRTGSGIEFVVEQAVSESLSKSEQTLQELEPQLRDIVSERGRKGRQIEVEVTVAIAKAKEELEKHRSFAA